MLTIGIDPGLSGALAVLDIDGQPELVADLCSSRRRTSLWRGHEGRAEALLIAWWAMRRTTPREAA